MVLVLVCFRRLNDERLSWLLSFFNLWRTCEANFCKRRDVISCQERSFVVGSSEGFVPNGASKRSAEHSMTSWQTFRRQWEQPWRPAAQSPASSLQCSREQLARYIAFAIMWIVTLLFRKSLCAVPPTVKLSHYLGNLLMSHDACKRSFTMSIENSGACDIAHMLIIPDRTSHDIHFIRFRMTRGQRASSSPRTTCQTHFAFTIVFPNAGWSRKMTFCRW